MMEYYVNYMSVLLEIATRWNMKIRKCNMVDLDKSVACKCQMANQSYTHSLYFGMMLWEIFIIGSRRAISDV